MLVINYGHPLSSEALSALSALLGGQVLGEVKEIRVQVDQGAPFAPQAAALVEAVGWSGRQWQQHQFVVVPPGLAPIAAVVLADIHGRCGHFPAIVRLAPAAGAVPARFVPAEIIDLAAVRDSARQDR